MKITIAFLKKNNACQKGVDWFCARPHLEGSDYRQVCAELEAEEDSDGDWSEWLRCRVAENTATPPESLARLAEDADSYVRYRVAENTATPPKTLAALSKDKRGYIRYRVAMNPAYKRERDHNA